MCKARSVEPVLYIPQFGCELFKADGKTLLIRPAKVVRREAAAAELGKPDPVLLFRIVGFRWPRPRDDASAAAADQFSEVVFRDVAEPRLPPGRRRD